MRTLYKLYRILLIFAIVKCLKAMVLDKDSRLLNKIPYNRVKRGYSKYGENDFGTAIHVSSGVLQYGTHDGHLATDASSQYANSNGWQPSQLSPSYEVWLEPSQSNAYPSPPHDISPSSIHPGIDQISNSVFSTDTHVSQAQTSGHKSELHTLINSSSSGIGSGIEIIDGDIDIGHHHHQPPVTGSGPSVSSFGHISDNIDFNNFADNKSKHYAKSYGK